MLAQTLREIAERRFEGPEEIRAIARQCLSEPERARLSHLLGRAPSQLSAVDRVELARYIARLRLAASGLGNAWPLTDSEGEALLECAL